MTQGPTTNPETLPPAGPGSQRRRRLFFVVCGVALLGGLYVTREVLLPFVLAVLIAYVLSPLVAKGQALRIGSRRPARWVVVLCIYVALLGAIGASIALALPRLAGEITKLTREAPQALKIVRDQWLPDLEQRLRAATAAYGDDADEPSPDTAGEPASVLDADPIGSGATLPRVPEDSIVILPRGDGGYVVTLPPDGLQVRHEGDHTFRIGGVTTNESKIDITAAVTTALARMTENTEKTATTVLATAQRIIVTLTRGTFLFFITLMLSAYMLITSDRIFAFFRSFYPTTARDDFDHLVQRFDRGLAGVVRGQLVICGVNGVLSGIGFYALGLKYWFFLTLLAAVLSVIPIFGSILSTVPAVLIALTDGLLPAVLVLGWILLIHQIEANVLNPKIMGDAARVHPVLVVFALLVGEHLGGIAGALLAVPALSVAQTLFLHFRDQALGIPRTSTPPPAPTAAIHDAEA